ncbi:MAG: leucine-rich repeat domain-containing protein [Treponema sp.]|nr:leucine-rich repeat domain-containing protein [Treponema sp.]
MKGTGTRKTLALLGAAVLILAAGCGNPWLRELFKDPAPQVVQKPEPPPPPAVPGTLILRVDAGADKAFTIPANNVWAYDWYIDWGDGTAEEHETGTGALDAGIGHTFPAAERYYIQIRAAGNTGHAAFGFRNNTSGSNAAANKQKLLKALGYLAENTSVTAFPSAWAYCFYQCTNLNEVSATLLPDVPNGTSDVFSQMFRGCRSLAALPAGFILPAVPNGTSDIFSFMFSGCSSLAALPAGFTLPAVPNGTSDIFADMFFYCNSLAARPEGLSLPDVPNGTSDIFADMFFNCSSLAALPEGFTLPAVPNGTSGIFFRMFYGCSSLAALPEGFTLPAVPNGTSDIFADMFRDCSKLAVLPAGFTLPAVPNGTSGIFSLMFYNCSSLAASINDLITVQIMDETRLNASSFNMSSTFSGCGGLTGFAQAAIQTGFGGAVPSSRRYTFYGCTGLSDHGSIPANWK